MVVNLDHFVKVIKYIKPPASSVCDMCIFPPSDDLYHIQKPSNRYRSSDISQVENKTKQLPSPSKQISATKSVVIHQNWSSKIDSPQKNSPQSCFHDELRPRFVNFWNWNVSESWQNETTLFGGIDNKSLCFFDLGGPFLENILWPLHHKLKKKRHLKIPKKNNFCSPKISQKSPQDDNGTQEKPPPASPWLAVVTRRIFWVPQTRRPYLSEDQGLILNSLGVRTTNRLDVIVCENSSQKKNHPSLINHVMCGKFQALVDLGRFPQIVAGTYRICK